MCYEEGRRNRHEVTGDVEWRALEDPEVGHRATCDLNILYSYQRTILKMLSHGYLVYVFQDRFLHVALAVLKFTL